MLTRLTPLRALLVSAVAAVSLSACDDPRTQAAIDTVRQQYGIPGLAAAVITSNTVNVYASGVRRLGRPERVGRNDLFLVGSDAKAMLATVIAREVEAGRLQWDTTIEHGLPGADIREEYKSVTLANLLQHRSGLPGFESADDLAGVPELTGTLMEQRQQFAQWVLTQESVQTPGEGFQYSNAGYVVAAAMLEHATGQPYEALMDAQLFKPLGIHPVYGSPAGGTRRNQPWGHTMVDGKLVPVDPNAPENQFPAWATPSGNLNLTAADFARFVQMHLRGLRGNPMLISTQSFQTLHTPTGDYAYGWLLLDDRGQRASAHSGSDDTFYAFMILEPGADAAAVVIANASSPSIDEAIVKLGIALLPRREVP